MLQQRQQVRYHLITALSLRFTPTFEHSDIIYIIRAARSRSILKFRLNQRPAVNSSLHTGKLNINALIQRASTYSLPPRTPVSKKPRTSAAVARLPPPSPSLFTQLITPIRRSAFLREFLPASPPNGAAPAAARVRDCNYRSH